MTTIRSFSGKTELYIGGSDGAGRYVRIENVEVEHADGAGDWFPRAEILKSLGVGDCDDMSDEVSALEERAKDAEAKLSAIREALGDPKRGYPAIHTILNPSAPFELPTLANAKLSVEAALVPILLTLAVRADADAAEGELPPYRGKPLQANRWLRALAEEARG